MNSADAAITPRGYQQANQIGRFLAGRELGIVASSPARRARQSYDAAVTAGHIVASCRLVSHAFAEHDWGEWAGGRAKDLFTPEIEAIAEEQDIYFRPPGGETIAETGGRMYDALAAYKDDVGLVIGHSLAIKSLIGLTLGWSRRQIIDYKIANGEVISFDPFSPAEPVSLFQPANELDPDLGYGGVAA